MSGYSKLTVGVLAIQGDFERHQNHLARLGAKSTLVKLPGDLDKIDGLIIPGGESTTLNIMLDRFNLREPLKDFGRSKPVWGTCAGLIMLAAEIEDNLSGVRPLELLDVSVIRNGYGRQVHSFCTNLKSSLNGDFSGLEAIFIRAPRIHRMGEKVTCLAKFKNDPVLVRQGNILASSFHTELGNNVTVLDYFLSIF